MLFLLFVSSAQPQEKFTISGHITDAETGEVLLGAAFQVVELKTGGMANAYGFYSVTIPSGAYTVRYSLVGYEKAEFTLIVNRDIVKDAVPGPESRPPRRSPRV